MAIYYGSDVLRVENPSEGKLKEIFLRRMLRTGNREAVIPVWK